MKGAEKMKIKRKAMKAWMDESEVVVYFNDGKARQLTGYIDEIVGKEVAVRYQSNGIRPLAFAIITDIRFVGQEEKEKDYWTEMTDRLEGYFRDTQAGMSHENALTKYKAEFDAEALETGGPLLEEEASEDVRGEKEWKDGDKLYWYPRAGNLFKAKEEAEKAVSPAGRRMQGCLREAKVAYKEIGQYVAADVDHRDHILVMALELFNTED